MTRRLTAVAALLVVALAPLAANASISPDNSYGTGGTATIPVQCTQTERFAATAPGRDGRLYAIQECAGGYFRVINVGNDGKLLTSWGTNGHLTVKVPNL